MFQMPVATRRVNAAQAITLKRRATARGASGEIRRSPGTRPASVSWPPTHTVAPRTCRKSRSVVQLTGSTRVLRRRRSVHGREAPGERFTTAVRATTVLGWRHVPALVRGIGVAQPEDAIPSVPFRRRRAEQACVALGAGDVPVHGRVVGSGVDHAVLGAGPEATARHAVNVGPGQHHRRSSARAAQPQIFCSVGYGSMAGPPKGWISKCRCGPVASPVAPTLPMISPAVTWRGGPTYWERWK